MRRLLLALLPLMLAGAAQASGPPEKKKEGVGQYIDLSPVALPIVVDGQLINYIFVQARVNLAASADAPKLREKEPYFRDALVRAGHRTPFVQPDDYTRINEAALKRSLLQQAAAIAGAKNVTSVAILSQTPKQRTNVPRPKAAHAG